MDNLKKYIQKNKKRGYTYQQITDYLKGLGYPIEIINQIYNSSSSNTKIYSYIFLSLSIVVLVSGALYFFSISDKGVFGEFKKTDVLIEGAQENLEVYSEGKERDHSDEEYDSKIKPPKGSACNDLSNLKPIDGIISKEFFASEESQFAELYIQQEQNKIDVFEKCLPVFNLNDFTMNLGSLGETDFYLVKPNNEKIAKFQEDSLTKMYFEKEPMNGIWKIGMDIKEVSNWPIQINIFSKVLDINIRGNIEKAGYKPNEPFLLKARVYFDKEYNLNGRLEAVISSELNLVKKIELYDDGKHGDNNPNDGVYANEVRLAEEGDYDIHLNLIGLIEDMEILREYFVHVWIKLFPDLIVKDVSLSNNNPKQHDNLIITTTIENIGEKIAENATIEFSYPDLYGDAVVGEDVVNVEVGETATASATWEDVPAGNYDLTISVSPFNSFLEKNYSNNKQTVKIEVGT